MKRFSRIFFSLILLVIILPWQAMAGPAVEIGYIEFPPVFFTDSQGKPGGFLIDLADQVLTKAGYQWNATSCIGMVTCPTGVG